MPYTIILVVKRTTTATNIFIDNTVNNAIVGYNAGTGHFTAGTLDATTGGDTTHFFVISAQYNDPSSILRVNGVQVASGSSGLTGGTLMALIIGQNISGNAAMTGAIAEIVGYSSVISPSDLNAVENNLGVKYNIAVTNTSTPQAVNLEENQSSFGVALSAIDGSGRYVQALSAGIPTDTPPTGTTVYDTTNHQLDIYDGSWKSIIENALPLTGGTLSGALTITPTSNQLVLGTTRTVTLTAPTPASSVTYTIPDAGGNANVVLDKGNYTIAGTWVSLIILH